MSNTPQPPAPPPPPAPARSEVPPPAAPASPTAAGADPAELPPKKVEFRNVLVLTMCGVVLVLVWLLVSFFLGHAGDPKKDLKTEMHAPDYQTDPQNAPLKTAVWYLRRCREALNRKDYTQCQWLLDDLEDQLKQRGGLLSSDQYLELQDLKEDLATATGQPVP